MGNARRGRQLEPWMDDGTGLTEAEIVLREAAVLLGAALLGVLHVVDAVIEAWPLPGSRVRK
jgi:hypothetical protein